MHTHPSDGEQTQCGEMMLVLAPHAWAWGQLEGLRNVWMEQAWPDGEPPLEWPQDLLTQLQDASRSAQQPITTVHLRCSGWGGQMTPDWWPDRKKNAFMWRDALGQQGLDVVVVERTRSDAAGGALKSWVLQAAWQPVWPTRWDIGKKRQRGSNAKRLLLSSAFALIAHALMAWGFEPAWARYRVERRNEQAQLQRDEAQRESMAKFQAREEEHRVQREQWVQEQHNALAPLQELEQLLERVDTLGPAQLWVDLRRAQGGWTVLGITHHEVTVADLMRHASPPPDLALSPTESVIWPPEPAVGWPARRFQLQAAFAKGVAQEPRP